MRSSKTLAFGLAAAGGGLAVLAAGRVWARLESSGAGAVPVSVTGRDAAPAGAALGLVALAGAVALVTAGRAVRYVVAAALVGCGAGLVAVRFSFQAARRAALEDAIARATGLAGPVDGFERVTVWPTVSLVGGALVLAAGGVALARSGRWSGPSRRYETTAAAQVTAIGAAASDRDRAYDTWDALSEGADPTDDPAPAPPPDGGAQAPEPGGTTGTEGPGPDAAARATGDAAGA